jgi:hypothetical protein
MKRRLCQFCHNRGKRRYATHYRRHAIVATDQEIYIPVCEECGKYDWRAARVPLAEVP